MITDRLRLLCTWLFLRARQAHLTWMIAELTDARQALAQELQERRDRGEVIECVPDAGSPDPPD